MREFRKIITITCDRCGLVKKVDSAVSTNTEVGWLNLNEGWEFVGGKKFDLCPQCTIDFQEFMNQKKHK